MKKLIVQEVNLFRSEVRTAARSNTNRQCVSPYLFYSIRLVIICFFSPCRLTIPSHDDIVASPIHDGAPVDGTTSGYYSGHTPQQGGAGAGRRAASPVIDDPSA